MMVCTEGNTNRECFFFWGWAWWDGGFCGMEKNKKSGGGDVRAKALSWDGEWDKV